MSERFIHLELQSPEWDEHPHCECGVTGVVTRKKDAPKIAALFNYAQINRGQHSNGVGWWSSDNGIERYLQVGPPQLVNEYVLEIDATMALGHTRYTTEGDESKSNIQPAMATWIDANFQEQELILSHNGNVDLSSIKALVKVQLPEGASDSLYIAQLIAESPGRTMADKLRNALPLVNGSYSLTILSKEGVFGIRDPRGNRPLHLADYQDGITIIASEDFPLQSRQNICPGYPLSIPPGTLVHITPNRVITIEEDLIEPLDPSFCSLESMYLGRPENLNDTRVRLGRKLAKEHPLLKNKTDAEKERIAVVGIPRGGDPFAAGYAQDAQLKNYGAQKDGGPLLQKKVEIRSFMAPLGTNGAEAKRKMALDPTVFEEMIQNGIKEIVLVDDSLVRGNQIEPVVDLIRGISKGFGVAIKIHVALGCPEVLQECGLGIALDYDGLFYNRLPQIIEEFGVTHIPETPERQLAKVLELYGIDSLYHLSKKGMLEAFTNTEIPEGMVELAQLVLAHDYCLYCMREGDEFVPQDVWYRSKEY
ncbi:hypothetical protein CO051_00320 [Candidatus Roizmanbacteria bacterium CG_4_9_14_0_2_um_filter_39_13]|uniref:Glutamine amidotransferase type-2 domain-containing protein n=2 Tax=Candidatus Roizmaniibacteriota TaxID=1752723 RepID=A0A2M8F4I7_9BACT|nr:MAG: hypothetical protein COY15_00465 [Candidatus Roizmanbacteria bacterium CG_4_10_14_0_2_um_filter_39_12]PJC34161.1 MAG: hypothetical protein CO051_00320 [Candidatus Roizmanbacteria bacterium CG_4_9_14_0_2_um_filter_39_13]PJE62166.1 MAG: hypothetical protein COU87_00655 [Candidatus Roizmanbacteria bacterium CG10_big_fil_rev_8_21_14_0_10_39_12]